jgi:hypothetical protein
MSPRLGSTTYNARCTGGGKLGTIHMANMYKCIALAAVGTALISFSTLALALQPDPAEREKLKACEKAMCTMVTKKEVAGADLACSLSKTWTKDQIQSGIEKKKISWSLGDAQCTLDVKLGRAAIIEALSKPEQALDFGAHTVKCLVDREGKETPINITMAPKITFKGGQAVTAILGVKEIDAPSVVKGAIWTAAALEDSVGIFHSDILKGINDFIGPKCTKAMAE